jgi:hypothetical protein
LGKYYREYKKSAQHNIAHYKGTSTNGDVMKNDQNLLIEEKG